MGVDARACSSPPVSLVVLSPWLLALAALLVAAGIAGRAVALWLDRRPPLPSVGQGATVVASDTGAAPRVLPRDAVLGLRGRPDYLVEVADTGGALLVPVEVKPSRRARRLYESDRVQLAAYLLALRATCGARAAPFGYVRYTSATFRVELTEELERRVAEIVVAVRAGRRAAVVHRSRDVTARARGVRCASGVGSDSPRHRSHATAA